MMSFKKQWMVGVAGIVMVLGAGCSDEEADQVDAGDTVVDAGKDDSGSGSGSGSDAATDSAAPALDVKCGSNVCTGDAMAAGFIDPCCADEATGTCGTSFLGAECAAAVEPDPRCESIDIMGALMIPSCCTADGQCGIDVSMFDMPGCTSLQDAAAQAEMSDAGSTGMGAMGVTLPEPRACDGSVVGDAGMDDAGN